MATLKIADLADHYTDAEAIAAVEGEATLDLTGDVTIAAAKSLAVDTIAEKTGAAGVTIDTVLVKDGEVDGRDVSVDGTKLDGIEAGADVTDAANVDTAGAVMEADADWVDLTDAGETALHSHAGGGAPDPHAASHEDTGGDEISVAGLSGELADDQPPKAHDYDIHTGGVPCAELEYDDATSDPLIDGAAAADGTENSAARKDHVHPLHHAQSHNVASHSDTTATGAETETLTDGSDADALHDHTNHGVTHNAAHGISKHTEHANWKALYTDGSGDEQEIALGADGTVFTSTGAAGVPAFEAGGGGGAVATDVIWDAAGDLAIADGADSAVKLSIGADHTALVSNGTTASWSAAPPLAAIADTGDTTRITIGTATPHLTLTGDERINGRLAISSAHVAGVQIEVAPTVTTSDHWVGLEVNPTVTLDTATKGASGLAGTVLAKPQSTTHSVKGLSFVATVQSDAAGVTLSAMYGATVKASVIAMPAKDMNIAVFSMLKVDSVPSPTALAALTFGTFKVLDLPTAINITDADITMPAIAYGIHLGDLAGARFNTVHLLEIGPATPYLRLLGKADGAANTSNLLLKLGANLKLITEGDADSGGTGYRVLRVPN